MRKVLGPPDVLDQLNSGANRFPTGLPVPPACTQPPYHRVTDTTVNPVLLHCCPHDGPETPAQCRSHCHPHRRQSGCAIQYRCCSIGLGATTSIHRQSQPASGRRQYGWWEWRQRQHHQQWTHHNNVLREDIRNRTTISWTRLPMYVDRHFAARRSIAAGPGGRP